MTTETSYIKHYNISRICDAIHNGTATQDDMTFFMRNAHPLLQQNMLKFIMYRAAGLTKEAHKMYYGKYPPPT